jgi:hypothetical protein
MVEVRDWTLEQLADPNEQRGSQRGWDIEKELRRRELLSQAEGNAIAVRAALAQEQAAHAQSEASKAQIDAANAITRQARIMLWSVFIVAAFSAAGLGVAISDYFKAPIILAQGR